MNTKSNNSTANKKTAASVAKTETKPAENSAAKDKAVSKTSVKPASAVQKTVSKATASKKTTKSDSAKTAPAKRTSRKPKIVEIAEICEKVDKLIDKKKAASIDKIVAADVEVWGWEDNACRHFYIEVKDGTVTVSPHEYCDCSFNAYISYENILKFINGKLSLKDAVSSGVLNANGNIPAAILVGSLF